VPNENKTTVIATAVVVGFLVGAATAVIIDKVTSADDDRAPIRVKNRKLLIETDYKKWKDQGTGKDWKFDSIGDVSEFVVTAFGSDQACDQRGTEVVISYTPQGSTPQQLTLKLDGQKPMLTSTMAMEQDSVTPEKLKVAGNPDGAMTRVAVTGASNPCTFSGGSQRLVEICLHDCQ
jgi:hypothetical protein